MFDIKVLLTLEANFQNIIMPITINIEKKVGINKDDNGNILIRLTRKNNKKDLSAIIQYLINVNCNSKLKDDISLVEVQNHINLLTGNSNIKD